MPLPFAHGLLGASLVAAIHPQPSRRYFTPLVLGAFLANCPDLDFILVRLFHFRGWHRAFTHSLTMALMFFLISIFVLGAARLREAMAYSLAFASHGLLDFATTKFGGGVELLWPFTSQRFKLGLVGLSELPSKLTSIEIVKSVLEETAIFLPLFLLVLLIRYLVYRKQNSLTGTVDDSLENAV
jgi:membrane-bound metal-dependent hydrolase YbcI (DUF457 family)